MIDADCKSAEYKRLVHFLMPDCKSGRTPNGYQITTESKSVSKMQHLAHGFFFPLPFHFFTKITRIVKIETLC